MGFMPSDACERQTCHEHADYKRWAHSGLSHGKPPKEELPLYSEQTSYGQYDTDEKIKIVFFHGYDYSPCTPFGAKRINIFRNGFLCRNSSCTKMAGITGVL